MYEDFFGLKTLPFKITPDPAFIYWNRQHRRAASILAFGIEQLVPITVVTGDVGTGKTTLLQQFLEDAPAEMSIGLISNYWSGMGGLFQWVLNAFDIKASGTEVQLFRAFEDFVIEEYAAGRRCVLIVDEAQNVSDEDLEQLRMLTNINSRKDSLLMLFLVGQPQLRDRLRQPENRQIAQRVGAAFHLGPLSREDTGNYIRHRISVAGGTREIFTDDAITRIFETSGGVPRLINVVSELALVTAFGDEVPLIDGAFMDQFLQEAAETGLIAHLPPELPKSDKPAAPPKPSRTSATPIPLSGRRGNGHQSIRLVRKPDAEIEEDAAAVSLPKPEAPAARLPEPPGAEAESAHATPPPTFDTVRAKTAQSQPASDRKDHAAGPEAITESPIATQPSDTPETPAEQPAFADISAPAAAPVAPSRTVLRSLPARLLDEGLNGALIGLTAVSVYLTLPDRTPDASPPAAARAMALPQSPAAPVQPAAPAEPETVLVEDTGATAPERVVALDDPDAAVLMEQALTSDSSNPIAATISYSRAALRGRDRAAYYLGQLYETGAGVPRDLAVARAWYTRAQDNVRSARRRLADIGTPDHSGQLAAPMPLLGGPLPGGAAEFIWAAGDGADAAFYIVEVSQATDVPPTLLGPVSVTALGVASAKDMQVWRVLAADPVTATYAVSDWYPMGGGLGSDTLGQGEVAPRVSIVTPGTPAEQGVSPLAYSLTVAGLTVTTRPASGGIGERGIVGYAYANDRAAAEEIAAIVGQGARAVMLPAPEAGLAPPLPGEITVVPPGP